MTASEAIGGHEAARSPRTSERQEAAASALLAAGTEMLREVGYAALSLRAVATRAGVTHTTAYVYFSSKAHLVAEILWSRLRAVPNVPTDPRQPLADRIVDALRGPGLLLEDEDAVAQASLAALLSDEPDVRRLRDAIGADVFERIAAAFGDQFDPDAAEVIMLTFSGAMLQAGMGYFDFAGVVERVGRAAVLVDPGREARARKPKNRA